MAKRTRAESGSEADLATRGRLIDAAGEVFAAKGFKAATVRDICQRAGANVAAINYHFGDKERLYVEVLRHAHHCAMERHPPEMGVTPAAPAPQRLRAFVVSFLRRMFDEGRPGWQGKIMSREIVEPTAALGRLVKEDLHPRRDQLKGICREIIGPGADDALLRHCAMSVVGQCIAFFHTRRVLERMFPEQRFDAEGVEDRAEQIYRFSLAALEGMPASGSASSNRMRKRAH